MLQGAEPRPRALCAAAPHHTSATERHGQAGRAGRRRALWERPGARAAAGPAPPAALDSCASGTEPARRASVAGAAPAAATAAAESCDDWSARAGAAAWAGAQPLPSPSPAPAQPLPSPQNEVRTRTVTLRGGGSQPRPVPGGGDGGAVSWRPRRC